MIKRATAAMLTARDVTDNLLPQLKMPVLIAWGDLDRITPLDQAQTMHRLIPQSELEVFAGCGHLAPLQCTSEIGPKVVNSRRNESTKSRADGLRAWLTRSHLLCEIGAMPYKGKIELRRRAQNPD